MTIWRMCIACRLPKATNTQSECVILIAFPLPAVVTRTRLSVTLYINVFVVLNKSATYSREALPIHGYARHHISESHRPELKIVIGRFLKNLTATCSSRRLLLGSLSSSLARQPLVGPVLLKKLCPFVSVEGDFLPILDP